MNGKTQLILLICFIYFLGIVTGYAYSQSELAEKQFKEDIAKEINRTKSNSTMLFNYTNMSLNFSDKKTS